MVANLNLLKLKCGRIHNLEMERWQEQENKFSF